jgi:hypothetical protein
MSHRDTPELRDGQKLTAQKSSESPRTDALTQPMQSDFVRECDENNFWSVVSLARQLEIELSQERERGRWIPVSERLPEPDAWVLTTNGKWTGVARHRPLEDDGYMIESERWQSETSDFIEHLGPPVTHWQPLPSAPGKAEE